MTLEKLRTDIGYKQEVYKRLVLKAIHTEDPEDITARDKVETELDELLKQYQELKDKEYGQELQR